MYCKNCGNLIDDDSNFCNYCGTRQTINLSNKNQKSKLTESAGSRLHAKSTENQKGQKDKGNQKRQKFDYRYTKEKDATYVGILLIVINVILYSVNIENTEKTMGVLLVGSLFLRILIISWVVNIAKRQNRDVIGWGILAFLFPAITLIIIGLMRKKLNLNYQQADNNRNRKPLCQKESIKQLGELRKTLQTDEVIIMNKEDWSYQKMNKNEWYKAKASGADLVFTQIEVK